MRLTVMQTSIVILLLVALAAASTPLAAAEPAADLVVSRIALGSCAKQDRPMPIWSAVSGFKPDVLLMLGDNIYGDTEDMAVLRGKYDLLAADRGFGASATPCRSWRSGTTTTTASTMAAASIRCERNRSRCFSTSSVFRPSAGPLAGGHLPPGRGRAAGPPRAVDLSRYAVSSLAAEGPAEIRAGQGPGALRSQRRS